jgi:hypothetical protein
LTGYAIEDHPHKNQKTPTEALSPTDISAILGLGGDAKIDPPQKVFFKPEIYAPHNNIWSNLQYTFKDGGKPAFWAGTVQPGQSFKEAIASELKKQFDYHGHFDQGATKKLDILPDKNGNYIQRYAVTIVLYEPLSVQQTAQLNIHIIPAFIT